MPTDSYPIGDAEIDVWKWGKGKGLSQKVLSSQLLKARLSSLERFIGSFLRENIGNIWSHTEIVSSACDIRLNQTEKHGGQNAPKSLLRVRFSKGSELLVYGSLLPLRRFYLTETPILKQGSNKQMVVSLSELFDLFRQEAVGEVGNWEVLREDFLNSNANLFLALLLRNFYSERGDSKSPKQVLCTNSTNKDEQEVFFEQWSINGHPLHPTPKSKTGVSMRDLLKFLPESHTQYRLVIGALRKDKASSVFMDENTSVPFLEYTKKLAAEVRLSIRNKDLNPDDYYIFPIHPWQYENLLREDVSKDLESDDFLILDGIGILALPLVAFRTVFIPDFGVYLKLPINIQVTSVKRTLSSKPCHNGVVLSRVLQAINSRRGSVDILSVQLEIASYRLRETFSLYKNLSFVVREGISQFLSADDVAVPALALFEDSEISGRRKIFDEVFSLFMENNIQAVDIKEHLLDFFKKYTAVVLVPALDLLTKFGIGLEAHSQNSLIVFRKGVPHKLIYRDLDAVNVCLRRFGKHDFLRNDFYPESWTVSDDIYPAQDKVMHSLIHSHISELINHISLHYGIEPDKLWKIIGKKIYTHLSTLSKDSDYEKESKEDIGYFFSKHTELKSLLRMKILGETNNYIRVSIENPLRKAIGEEEPFVLN